MNPEYGYACECVCGCYETAKEKKAREKKAYREFLNRKMGKKGSRW